jgi:D-3-phosphoglycerate dehydrogenase
MIDIEGDVSDEIIPGLEAKIREIGGIVTTRII